MATGAGRLEARIAPAPPLISVIAGGEGTGITLSAVASPLLETTTVAVKRWPRVIEEGPAWTATERSAGAMTFVVADTGNAVDTGPEVFASIPVAPTVNLRLPDPLPFSVIAQV